MATVMVMGGGGFVGSHVCKRLVAAGHRVVAVDIEWPEYRMDQWRGVYSKETVDLRDSRTVNDLIGGVNPDYLFQFAADMGGVEYFHSTFDWSASVNNALINYSVLAALGKRVSPPRTLFTSTACAYATEHQMTSQAPLLIEDDINWGTPDQLYGLEKRTSALLYDAAPFQTRVAMLHSVYGPYQEHSGIKMKFPSAACQKARRSRKTKEMELFGDGRQQRSYLYIDDAVDRLMTLMFDFDESPGFVNIGSETAYNCAYVAEQALTIAHEKAVHGVKVNYTPGPTGVRSRSCDNTKAKTLFDMSHTVSLRDGLARFIEWLDEVDPQ